MAQSDSSMAGKTCLVTGATAGIGLVTARVLAEKGATVVVVGRSPARADATVAAIRLRTGNPQVDFLVADLSSQADIRRLAGQFLERYPRLDVLVNNAGALFLKRQESVDGIEMTFALNHLGYFLLTELLLDRQKACTPARIVNVSSAAHRRVTLDFDDLQAHRHYRGFRQYSRSKLANLLFTYELSRRLQGSGVTANALHPGFVLSNFGTNNGWWRLLRPIFRLMAIDVEEGALTTIYAATAPELEKVTGEYFDEQHAALSSAASHDPDAARRLWQISEQMTGMGARSA